MHERLITRYICQIFVRLFVHIGVINNSQESSSASLDRRLQCLILLHFYSQATNSIINCLFYSSESESEEIEEIINGIEETDNRRSMFGCSFYCLLIISYSPANWLGLSNRRYSGKLFSSLYRVIFLFALNRLTCSDLHFIACRIVALCLDIIFRGGAIK